DFTGVVVATGGVRVTGAGRLAIGGALWVGAPAAGGLLLDVAGSLALRQQSTAIAAADRLLALPRRPVLLGMRDLGYESDPRLRLGSGTDSESAARWDRVDGVPRPATAGAADFLAREAR